jgi:Reverse transcriptase (RNA-dependent DNA polymerase)
MKEPCGQKMLLSQVQGKDIADSHAPVMTVLSLRLALIVHVLMKLSTRQFDIDIVFLYSEIDEEIYMRFPEGYVRQILEVHSKVIDPSTHAL